MGRKLSEYEKEQRKQDKERHKLYTYVDKEKANEILAQYERKLENRRRFRKYGT